MSHAIHQNATLRGRCVRAGLFVAMAAMLAGCAGASDLLSKDAEWFSRPSGVFGKKSLSMGFDPLSPTKAVAPDDLVGADGSCSGMTPRSPVDSHAQMTAPGETGNMNATAPSGPSPSAGIALEMTECEVARSEGLADNVAIGVNERGDREVTLTYLRSSRPGIYRFTAGRLSSIERAPELPKPEKPKRKVAKRRS